MWFAGAAFVVAILYWAQAILIPIVLAMLLTFLLAPVVGWLQLWKLNRSLSVALVVLLTLLLLGGTIWLAALQVGNLADELPHYRANIRQKIGDLRNFQQGGVLEKLSHMIGEVKSEFSKGSKRTAPQPPASATVAAPATRPFVFEKIAQPLAGAGLVWLLLIYMLAQREELRNRVIRLIGYGNLSITTQALEEMGARISHYLLTQLAINSSFGLLVAIALALIDLPYAFLWGFMSTFLIFVPVIGFWIAAALPTILSLAVFTSWVWPLAVVGLFLVLKTVINVVLEPVLYGKSAGVLQVPLLVLLAFWTWLWGPIGLILATPLTVCLLVFAKHVPELQFLSLLMSDQPAMETSIQFYQRLLALDYDEAAEIIESYRREHRGASAAEISDVLLLAALRYAKTDQRRGHLNERQEKFIFATIAGLQEDVLAAPEHNAVAQDRAVPPMTVLGIAAEGEADARALALLGALLDSEGCAFDVGAEADVEARLRERAPQAVVIAALPPGGMAQTRRLCKRLRALLPSLNIMVLRGAQNDDPRARRESFIAAGASSVALTLREARVRLQDAVPHLLIKERPMDNGTEANLRAGRPRFGT